MRLERRMSIYMTPGGGGGVLYIYTVRMKSLTMFSGALHLLHHYKSNLAHLLAS